VDTRKLIFPNISAIYDDSYHIFQATKRTELQYKAYF